MIPMPPRIAKLPRDHRGFPSPWFVQWFDDDNQPTRCGTGHPDFRVVDTAKFYAAINQRRCWVCGEPMGSHLAFLIGPMCAVNRTTSEPPSHRECALYSAAACPFLSRPRMRRNDKELPEHREAAGLHLDHNPGAMALWMTHGYQVFRTSHGNAGLLIRIGVASRVDWLTEGRPASRAEVQAAIDKGLPTLREMAELEGRAAVDELDRYLVEAERLLPAS